MLTGKRITLGITGSIAAYKGVEILRELKKLGGDVVVIMTEAGMKFVCPLTYETLSGHEVVTSLFPPHRKVGTRHVALAQWADLALVAPATANFLGKLANGIADDILSTVIMATRAPVVVCPAMNVNMYRSPVVQQNLAKVKALGYHIVGPESGELACGDEGEGRLTQVGNVVRRVLELLVGGGELADKCFLVTAGRTEEPLDPVRHLTNRSTGRMGYALAEAARDRGGRVTLVSGPSALSPPRGVEMIRVRTAEEMRVAVQQQFPRADVLIMAAAVADYRPSSISPSKIKKSKKGMVLELEPTVDILLEVGRGKKSGQVVVGFAVETEKGVERATEKLRRKNLDLIILNDPTQEGAGFGGETNIVTLIDREGKIEEMPKISKRDVAERVIDRIATFLDPQGVRAPGNIRPT